MELKCIAAREGRLSSFLQGELKVSYGLMNKLKWGDAIQVNGVPQRTNFQVQPGDVVTVKVRVPARELDVIQTPHEDAEVSGVVDVPWLPGTGLSLRVNKGRKKSSAGVRFSVTGQPSGTVHIGGLAQKNGHSRGEYYGTAYARDMRVIDGLTSAFNDSWASGDVRLIVWGEWYNAGSGYLRLLFPGFAETLRFKVSAVTRHG